MKNSGIKYKTPVIEITINEREAKRILIDLELLARSKELMPETKQLRKMLEKFEQ